jgi:hypothetical protein
MLLMTGNTRSAGVSQGRPKGAAPAVGAQRRALTDDGAEGISATDADGLCFVMVPQQQL